MSMVDRWVDGNEVYGVMVDKFLWRMKLGGNHNEGVSESVRAMTSVKRRGRLTS